MMKKNYDTGKTGMCIRKCREKKGISQEKASEEIGVSLKHYSEIERGVKRCSIETFVKICRLYECSPDYLLFGNTDCLPGSLMEEFGNASEARKSAAAELLSGILNLPE